MRFLKHAFSPAPAILCDCYRLFVVLLYVIVTCAIVKDPQDIVRYDTAAGKREVFVSAAKLIPPGATVPLAIEHDAGSKDKSKLLIFTNSKSVSLILRYPEKHTLTDHRPVVTSTSF